jgi:hypothetical protein
MNQASVTIPITPARKGETLPRVWYIESKASKTAPALPVDLTGVTAVRMHYRRDGENRWKTISTISSAALAVTNAAQGEITFTPPVDFWQVGIYIIYFSVDTGTDFNVPNTDNYSIEVVDGV